MGVAVGSFVQQLVVTVTCNIGAVHLRNDQCCILDGGKHVVNKKYPFHRCH